MESSNEIAETSGSKRQKSSEAEQDRISSFPDCVLVHIHSFLPMVDAVKTLLFPRFGHLWTFIQNLDFDECSYHVCMPDQHEYCPTWDKGFLNFIKHALILHQSSTIYQFRLRFFFNLYYLSDETMLEDPQVQNLARKEKKVANEIDTWNRFAIRREVKVLHLDFFACGWSEPDAPTYSYRLPYYVFSSDFLMELKLANCRIVPRGRIHMCSLKILSLEETCLSDKMLNEILSGCPLLEDLSLIECYGLHKLNFTAQNIKKLVLIIPFERKPKLEISCPNLISFYVSGYIGRVQLMNISSLTVATIKFNHNFYHTTGEYHQFRELLEKLHHPKVLTLCDWFVLVLTAWVEKNLPCPLNKWKCVVLKTRLTKWHLQGISSLLRNSPTLEALTIYVEGSSDSYIVDGMGLGSYDFDGENYWSSQELSFNCLAHHLKTVKIYGFITGSSVIQLLEFLLKSAFVLETLVISSKRNFEPSQRNHFTSEELLEFSQKLLSFQRASTRAVVLLS